MRMTFLSILVILLSAAAVTSGEQCRNLVPGLKQLMRGVDITTLDLLPMDFSRSHGYKKPLFQFSCDEGKKFPINGTLYDEPDQVMVISSLPTSSVTPDMKKFSGFTDLKTEMRRSTGLVAENEWPDSGVTSYDGAFSLSNTYRTMQNAIVNRSVEIEMATSFYSTIQVDFLPYWAQHFRSGVEANHYTELGYLQETFESSPSFYKGFFQNFGTHFFKSAQFGGATRTFVIGSNDITKYYGGNKEFFNFSGSDMTSWLPSIDTNPWLLSADLLPVSQLISNVTIRASMDRAITNHLNKALLLEYERLLVPLFSRFPTSIVHFKESLQELLLLVRSAQRQMIPSQDIVNSIKTAMEVIDIPSWFIYSVEICYEGDYGCNRVGKKGGPQYGSSQTYGWKIKVGSTYDSWLNDVQICYRCDVDSEECAGPGAYTERTKLHGCDAQWKVKVPSYASPWMRFVRLCHYRYREGASEPRQLCANINEWTPKITEQDVPNPNAKFIALGFNLHLHVPTL